MKVEYAERFIRNIGIMDEAGLERIRTARVAIGGLGLGGSIFINLVRLGFERFHIADPDIYERANVNRQRGAKESTCGRRKDESLLNEARDINPDIDVKVFKEGVKAANVSEFLRGVDWVVDVVDLFAMSDKLLLNAAAYSRRLPVASCASLGYSGTLVFFEPGGPSFAELSGISDQNSYDENFRRFLRFIAPEVPAYMHNQLVRAIDRTTHIPFVVPGVEISAAMAASEISKRILGLGERISAPIGLYFDPLTLRAERFKASYLAREDHFGNRQAA